ncbi:MAG TPA: hypothetical protein VEA63_03160, partial [Opitutus sp.]|nr:hypothetical protein [Opitutus sp.]
MNLARFLFAGPHRLRAFVGLFCVLATFAVRASTSDASPRTSSLLDGRWEFQLDPDSVGIDQQWFAEGRPFPDHITVPGAWDAQGFGPETAKMRHNHIGKAWYRRQIDIPAEPASGRTFLYFGGVCRSARVWVNGREAGSHLGYVSDF